MPSCPNCGQTTGRTEDWACQWCGYPLFSKAYKKIPKTYKQLQEEKLHKWKLPLTEETEVSFQPTAATLPPTHELEPEPIPEPEAVPKPELEPAPAPKPKPKRARRSKAKATPKPQPVPEPEAVPEPEPEVAPAVIEMTAEELLSAYEVDKTAADAKFANKILKVTGVVNRIEVKDILDVYYITLTSVEKSRLQNVRCMFDKQHGPELSQLTPGQTVTVQGRYDGSIINIRLTDCVLVHE